MLCSVSNQRSQLAKAASQTALGKPLLFPPWEMQGDWSTLVTHTREIVDPTARIGLRSNNHVWWWRQAWTRGPRHRQHSHSESWMYQKTLFSNHKSTVHVIKLLGTIFRRLKHEDRKLKWNPEWSICEPANCNHQKRTIDNRAFYKHPHLRGRSSKIKKSLILQQNPCPSFYSDKCWLMPELTCILSLVFSVPPLRNAELDQRILFRSSVSLMASDEVADTWVRNTLLVRFLSITPLLPVVLSGEIAPKSEIRN